MLRLKIETTNAAFDGNPQVELQRILRQCAAMMETHIFDEYERKLMDVNGNPVGWIKWELEQ